MTDLTIMHRRPRRLCRCGCSACASEAAERDVERLARESLSVALMHAQGDFAQDDVAQDDPGSEATGSGAIPRRLPGIPGGSKSARSRRPARRPLTRRTDAAPPYGFGSLPPMHHAPMRLSKAVPIGDVLAGGRAEYDRPVTGEGRIYVLSIPGIARPLYVGEIRPDSTTQTLAGRLRQHFGGRNPRQTAGRGRQECFSRRNFRESCILREALQGRFDQLRKVLTRAGLGPDQQAIVERHLKSRRIYVQYAIYRLPKGVDRHDLNARTQLQHSAELSAKNQLRTLIRSNSLSFEEDEERQRTDRQRTGTVEYRVV